MLGRNTKEVPQKVLVHSKGIWVSENLHFGGGCRVCQYGLDLANTDLVSYLHCPTD